MFKGMFSGFVVQTKQHFFGVELRKYGFRLIW